MLFSKPKPPKPLEHWFQDVASINRLREILDDPAFELACACLLQAAMPSFGTTASGVNNNEKICWLSGYSDFVRDLRKLSKLPAAKTDYEEWSHIS